MCCSMSGSVGGCLRHACWAALQVASRHHGHSHKRCITLQHKGGKRQLNKTHCNTLQHCNSQAPPASQGPSGMVGQGMPGQGMPGQGLHSGMPGQGMPGQGMPGQGMPGQGLHSGMPGQGMAGQGPGGQAAPHMGAQGTPIGGHGHAPMRPGAMGHGPPPPAMGHALPLPNSDLAPFPAPAGMGMAPPGVGPLGAFPPPVCLHLLLSLLPVCCAGMVEEVQGIASGRVSMVQAIESVWCICLAMCVAWQCALAWQTATYAPHIRTSLTQVVVTNRLPNVSQCTTQCIRYTT